MPPTRKSANPTIAVRRSLPRKCKTDSRRKIESRRPRQPRATPTVNEEKLQEHPRVYLVDLFRFRDGSHDTFVQDNRAKLKFAVSRVLGGSFVKTVEWDALDTDTQNKLTGWAPKAKEFLEHVRGSRAWLWRIIVDRVFHGPGDEGDCEDWGAYSTLEKKINGINAEDMPEELHLHETTSRDAWLQVVEARLQSRAVLWRCLTVHLLTAAGHRRRHTVEHVVELVFQELGRWLMSNEDTRRIVTAMAKFAVDPDWHIHHSTMTWGFSFQDPDTGRAHGFPFKQTKHVIPHLLNGDTELEGRPADVIVSPLVTYWGDFRDPEPGRQFHQDAQMVVAVDLFPDDDDGSEEAQEPVARVEGGTGVDDGEGPGEEEET